MKKDHSFRDEIRTMEQAVRNTPAIEFMATPVLDENQWEIDRLIRGNLPAATWNLFSGTCLSAFFDPEDKKYLDCSGDRDLIFRSTILFTVTTRQPFCHAVLMVIEPGQPELEAFLNWEGARWLRYASLQSPSEFANQVTDAAKQGEQSKIGQRKKVDESEFKVWRGLKNNGLYELERNIEIQLMYAKNANSENLLRALTGATYRLLQEVAIDRLRPKRAPSMSAAAEHISRTSSVDILIHSRGKVNLPLLAIEVDGSIHRNPKKMKKDRAKDEVMDAFRIPLIRIATGDADFWHKSREQPKGGYEKLARFTKLIGAVANHISFQVQIENQFVVENDTVKMLYQKLEDKAAKAIFGELYVNLNSHQRIVVDESLITSPELSEYEMVGKHFNFHNENAIKEITSECKWPDDLTKDSAEPEIVGDPLSGLSAWTVLTLPGRAPLKITTPSIHASGKYLDEEVLSLNLRCCLIEDLAGEVRARLGSAPPASDSSAG